MKKTVIEVIEYAGGTKYWYRDGVLHRDGGPAIEYGNGDRLWYRNGKRHRDDGPAAERANGTKEWWRDGKYHRDDGPAFEYANGDKEWWRQGKRHRNDGPAIDLADGRKAWYIDGQRVTEESYNARRQTEQSSTKPEFNEVAALKARVEQTERRLDALEHRSPQNQPAKKSPGAGP